MAGFQPAITIYDAMCKISKNEYLLPAFQRKYVWKIHQVEIFFDSLMRGYPIGSMLFWQVEKRSETKWKFYSFLRKYREKYHTLNEHFNTNAMDSFYAVLDGQQRLTSLYLALFGEYHIHKKYHKWDDEDDNFKICHLYFNLTQSKEPKNPNIEYEFLWLNKKENNKQDNDVFKDDKNQKWLSVNSLCKYYCENKKEEERKEEILQKLKEYTKEQCKENLTSKEEQKIELLYDRIFENQLLNFYLETEQNPDKAVNIFIRVNSGGTNLNYSDILFSIAIANWKKEDAKTKINELVDDKINKDFGFKISKDLILKGFLYLFHNNIKFQINSFDKDFIESIEAKWDSIRKCFVETFRLLRSFGLNAQNLSSNNAVLPILYFIYHKNLTNKIVDSVSQKENRTLIKKWLLRVLILKPLGGSSDTVLANMRKAFIKEFKQNSNKYFDDNIDKFPLENIEEEAKYKRNIDDEFLDKIMLMKKDNAGTFAILSFLYPNLDYKNNNFDKDHLHPRSAYKQYEKSSKEKQKEDLNYKYLPFESYDALPNLRLYDSNENKAKQGKPLKDWVDENCGNDRKGFLQKHLIPDIDLSLDNFDEFYEARKKLLIERLKEILNS